MASSSTPLTDNEKLVLIGVGALAAGGLSKRARSWVDDHLGSVLGPLREHLSMTTLLLLFCGAVAVFLLARWAWRRRSARRARILARLENAVTTVVGTQDDVAVRVRRWRRGRPQRFVVDYPVRWEDSTEGRRAKLRTVLEERVSEHLSAAWSETQSRVVFTAAPRQDEHVLPQQEAGERVDTLLRQAVPTITSTRVLEWSEAAGAAPAKVPARVEVSYRPDVRTSSERFRTSVAAMLSTQLPGRWAGEWDTEHDRAVFKRRHELNTLERHPLDKAQVTTKPCLRYGVTEHGYPLEWNVSLPTQAHALVIGPTGGGKTTALRALVFDACRQGVEVIGCDPKRIELMGIVGWPGVSYIATGVEEQADLIHSVFQEMERRYLLIEQRKVTRDQLRPVLFILDEYFILRMRLNRWWAENKKAMGGTGTNHPALGEVQEMLALARSARIHIALGIQRPDAEFLEGAARDNLRHRVSLTQLSQQGAMMMWDNPQDGTDLPLIAGRAIATGREGKPVEGQVWLTPDPDPAFLDKLSAQERDELARLCPDPATLPAPVFGSSELGTAPVELSAQERDLVAGAKAAVLAAAKADDHGPSTTASVDEEGQDEELEWVDRPAAAEAVVVGDFLLVDVEGQEWTVEVVDVEEDPMDEDNVVLSWADTESEQTGALSLPGTSVLNRLEAVVPVS